MVSIVGTIMWAAYGVSLYFVIFWLLVYLQGYPEHRRKEITDLPVVTVAVPAFNESKTIRDTLNHLVRQNYPPDKFEVIVVNDGSTDSTAEIVNSVISLYPSLDIKLINQKNSGKGVAMNKALSVCKGEYFVCLDADSFADFDAIKKMIPFFDEPKVAIILPCLKVDKPKSFLQIMQWYEYLINMFYKELMGRLHCIHVAPGPFSMYNASILKKVGGFHENNLTEDLEIVLRMQEHGYIVKQLYTPTVTTIAPVGMKQLYKQRSRWYKGAFLNVFGYRHMLFNPKYGDFGMIQIPTVLVSGILAMVIILSMFTIVVKPLFNWIYDLFLIGFDISIFFNSFIFDFNVLDLNYAALFIFVFMIMVTSFVLYHSHKKANERVFKYNPLALVFYLGIYYLIQAAMWVGITIELLFGRRQKW